MRDDASVSGRGGRYRHPHPSQQPMSLQGSRMGSYGRIDGSRKSALQNEIRSVGVTTLSVSVSNFKIFWLFKETPPKSKFAVNSISRSKQSHFFNSLFPSRANRFGYPVYPERELGIPSRTGPVSFAGFSPSVASSVARDQLHMTSILIPLFYPHPMCANSQKLGLFVATPDVICGFSPTAALPRTTGADKRNLCFRRPPRSTGTARGGGGGRAAQRGR